MSAGTAAACTPTPAPAASATHRQLLDVVLAQLDPAPPQRRLRLLDAGCGDGRLLAFLARSLAHHRPALELELHGFDVHDHGVQPADYFAHTHELLCAQVPGVPWPQRLVLISEHAPWPWPDESFDVVVSNQVLEHVRDHRHFMGQLRRVLRPGGFSVHIFPTRHCWIEPHLHIPLAHRIGAPARTARFIEWATRLGFGHHDAAVESRRAYALRHAEYLARNVNYKSVSELLALSAACGLQADFGHTSGLYAGKLRQWLGWPQRPPPARRQPPADGGAHATMVYRCLSSVTLLLCRPDAVPSEAHAASASRGGRTEVHRR